MPIWHVRLTPSGTSNFLSTIATIGASMRSTLISTWRLKKLGMMELLNLAIVFVYPSKTILKGARNGIRKVVLARW